MTIFTGPARLAVLALCAAQFLLIVDVVIITVALPVMRADLAVPDTRVQLVSITYTVTFGSLLIVFGRLGDLLGRRRLLLVGLVLFALASVAAGAALRDWQLFAARAAQGVAAAMVSANALACLNARFAEGPARARALGLWAAVGSAGAIAGQLLGGVITELFGWRWIFLINVPIAAVVVVVLARTLPESRAGSGSRVDVLGSVLLATGLGCGVLALAQTPAGGALAVLAAGLLVAFTLVERRHPEPVLRYGLLRLPGIRAANVTLFLNAGGLAASLFFATLYMQVVLGYSALAVGAVFAPVTLLILVLSPRAARLTGRYGVRAPLATGLALLTAGILLLARVPVAGVVWDVLPAMLLLALGSALAYAPTFVAASSGVPDSDQGAAAGLIGATQELGTAVCLAVLAFAATAAAGPVAAPAALTAGYGTGLLGAAGLLAVATLVALRTPRGLGRTPAVTPVAAAD